MKKIIIIVLACIFALSFAATGAGCKRSVPGAEAIDPHRTQIYVANFNGGTGEQWLKNVKSRFEADLADESFEQGKTGVQIMIQSDKENYRGKNLIDKIEGATQEVYFTETVNYYDFVTTGKFLEITDIVTEDLSEKYGESGTILDKMTAHQREYFNAGTEENPEYYALPHYEVYSGLTYDVDLWESENLYFKEGHPSVADYYGGSANIEQYFVQSANDKRASGPDGKTGVIEGVDYSADDGLPATYDEFFLLFDWMKNLGITPIIWNGAYASTYVQMLLSSLFVDYEGYDRTMLNFTFSGDADDIVTSIGSDGKVNVKTETIEPATGYLLSQQAGKYYALKFLEKLLSDASYYSNLYFSSFTGTMTHLEAQETYINSRFDNEAQPIGILLDGNWWENEATENGSFTRSEELYGEKAKKENRNFAWMPLPRATELDVGKETTMLDKNYTLAFINANVAEWKIPLLKRFLQYCYTDVSLQEFTETTGIARGLQYEMSDEAVEKMTSFSRSVWKKREQSEIVYPYSKNKIFMYNQSDFNLEEGELWPDNITEDLRKKQKTAETIFKNSAISASEWETKYGDDYK